MSEFNFADFKFMQKFISVDGGTTMLPVEDIYSYIYDSEMGKTVLRIKVKEEYTTFDSLKALLNSRPTISLYENTWKEVPVDGDTQGELVGELKNNFTNYVKDYTCNYEGGVYSVELTRKTATEIAVDAAAANNLDISVALVELYESIGV